MAQHDYILDNASGAAFRSDLNNALSATVTLNSGSSAPSTTYAYMLWADTGNGKLKIRNGANSAWIEVGDLATAGFGILSNIPLGTVSAPGLAFSGDPNTGIYSPTTDQVAIATGGVQRLNITTAGVLPTLPVRGADGTAANPAYSFSGDTDTGLYRSAANEVRIATGGVDAIEVDASQRVGIGNTSPAKKLDVIGSAVQNISALTDGATIAPDFDSANNFSVTLGGNRTLANPTNPVAGQSGIIFITQDGTGSRTLAFGSYWDFPGGTAPTLTTTAAAVDALVYTVRSSTSIAAQLIKDVK